MVSVDGSSCSGTGPDALLGQSAPEAGSPVLRAIEIHEQCVSPYSFCLSAAEHYFRKMGARLRFIASPFDLQWLPGVWWTRDVLATPKREELAHGRVPDEIAIVESWNGGRHPTLRVALRFEPLMPGCRLSISGWYEARSSFLAAVADGFAGGRIVKTSLHAFLEEIARSIDLQFEQFCTGVEMAHAVACIVEGSKKFGEDSAR